MNPKNTSCASNPTAQCLLSYSYIQDFQWGHTIPANYPSHLVPISQYFTDVQNGTLPQVAMIEPASPAGLDEHGSDSDQYPIDIQLGAQYTSLAHQRADEKQILEGFRIHPHLRRGRRTLRPRPAHTTQ